MYLRCVLRERLGTVASAIVRQLARLRYVREGINGTLRLASAWHMEELGQVR